METKHTPGPWRIATDAWGETAIESDNERDNADGFQVFVLAKSIGGRIHGAEFDDRSEVEANIKLIAAAPDLLAAAIEVLNGLNDRIDAAVESRSPTPVFEGIAALHDAINKATA